MEVVNPNTYFLQQGMLGVIIVVLAGVIVWLQLRYDAIVKEKDGEIRSGYSSMQGVQEQRIADVKELGEKFISLGKDLVSSDTAIQKSVDNVARVLELKNI